MHQDSHESGVAERVLAEALAVQAKGTPRVPTDAVLRVKQCSRFDHARSGRLIGHSGTVVVDEVDPRAATSHPIMVFLDPDGAVPILQAVTLP